MYRSNDASGEYVYTFTSSISSLEKSHEKRNNINATKRINTMDIEVNLRIIFGFIFIIYKLVSREFLFLFYSRILYLYLTEVNFLIYLSFFY